MLHHITCVFSSCSHPNQRPGSSNSKAGLKVTANAECRACCNTPALSPAFPTTSHSHTHTAPLTRTRSRFQIGDEFYMVSIRPLLEGGASVVAFHPRTRERLETVLDTSQSATVPSVHILNQPPPLPLRTACFCLCCQAAMLICLLLDAVACCSCCCLLLLLALLGGPGTVSKGDGQWEGLRGRMHIERDSDGVGTLVIDMPGDADGGASSHK